MNMKYLLKIIHIILIASFILHSCNSGVFINDYSPSVSEVRLSEKDSISEICFEASNWDVKSVFFMNKDGYYNEVKGDIYGYDGNMIAGNSSLYTNGLGQVKLTISHPDIKLTIERKDEKHLILSKSENMDYETKRIYLNIGNMYNSKQISVDIEPSSRYNLDSIVYTVSSYSVMDSMIQKQDVYGCINSTNHVFTFDVYPYKNFKIEYSFVNEHEWKTVLTEEQLKIFGKDALMVPVPVIDQYGSPVMSTVTLPLSAAVQNLPLPEEMLEIKETVSVSPNKQRACRIKCWYKYYGVWFNIYTSHPVTGEKRILKGVLDIYYPQSYEIDYEEETDIN